MYPKLRVTGINDKAGKELAEIISGFIERGAITVDEKLESFLRNTYKLPELNISEEGDNAGSPDDNDSISPDLQLGEGIRTEIANDRNDKQLFPMVGSSDSNPSSKCDHPLLDGIEDSVTLSSVKLQTVREIQSEGYTPNSQIQVWQKRYVPQTQGYGN